MMCTYKWHTSCYWRLDMYADDEIDEEFLYYFYLEGVRSTEVCPDYHLPDQLSLQQFGDRMRQLRDERYYA